MGNVFKASGTLKTMWVRCFGRGYRDILVPCHRSIYIFGEPQAIGRNEVMATNNRSYEINVR